jgi:5-oxoprolinase (ATP-hydrolysing) subunit A
MLSIDLNCDMGEGFGVYDIGIDDLVMPYITSANVACGFHASDPATMWKTVKLAARNGVAIGAHPSYPDLVGFGRRAMNATLEEISADVTYQIGALSAFCQREGVRLRHVKAHGALYNKAADTPSVATAIAQAIKMVDAELTMVCLSNSAMVTAAQEAGIPYVEEVFADRAYTHEGKLVSRSLDGAVLHDPDIIAQRVLTMVRERTVVAIDGTEIPLKAETICVHGDTAGSFEMIKAIRCKLEEGNVALKAFGH